MTEEPRLPVEPGRDRLMRLDSAKILKRFFHLERALVISCAAWVPAVHRLETKELLARSAWQNALTAGALRERVFELKYPDRDLHAEDERPLVDLFTASLHAPSGAALLHALATVLVPSLRAAYSAYLATSDDIADGPTRRFLELALGDKSQQARALSAAAEIEWRIDPGARADSLEWGRRLEALLEAVRGIGLDPPSDDSVPPVVPPGRRFELAQSPARDERYFATSFYWPDNLDPGLSYGEGLQLQLRSAISHLNEVWAVETAGAILVELADALGWEFIGDAARWLYDESRHMMMGMRRLQWWGLQPQDVPLGGYIYEACAGQDAVIRLGMLAFFETKNIGKKRERTQEFAHAGDRTSQRDMDFDWADEAIHAGYGRRWLRRALEAAGRDGNDWHAVIAECERLVTQQVSRATDDDRRRIGACAAALISKAEEKARA